MYKSGIYRIYNIVTKKLYIGSAVNLSERLYIHRYLLIQNQHINRYLQRSWNKYGQDIFKFEVLLCCDKENLIFYEQKAINVFGSTNGKGYNISPIAGSQLGFKHSKESLQKISETSKGRISPNKGKSLSSETKRKISESNKGQIAWNKGKSIDNGWSGKSHSKETKAKLSIIMKKLGNKPWLGRKHTDEAKKKVSDTNKGKTPWIAGKKHTEETKQKMSKSRKGRVVWNKGLKTGPRPEEIRQKISKTLKGHERYKKEGLPFI